MGLAADPRYVSLARRAAGKLGTSADSIVMAILAQWQCEISPGWPPTRNNPGNLARGAAQSIGVRFTVAPGSNPQPGNPIVTFATPEAGADAYAKLLNSGSRYAAVRAAVRARDGRAFLLAVSAAGYGTSATCSLGVFGGSAGAGSFGGGGLPAPSGPGGITLISSPGVVNLASATTREGCTRPFVQPTVAFPFNLVPGAVPDDVYPVPKDRLNDPCACAPGYNRAVIDPQLKGLFGTNYVPIDQLKTGEANACVKVGIGPGSITGQELDPTKAIAALLSGIPSIAANLGVMIGIGVIGYIGLRTIADGLGEG